MTDTPERIWAGNWLADVGETSVWDIGEWRDEPWQTVDVVEYVRADLATPLEDPRVKALPKPSVENAYWTVCPKVLEEIRQDAGEWAGEAYLQTVEAIALAVVRRIDALSALEENK